MRWKLLLAASLLASVVGACAAAALSYALTGSASPSLQASWVGGATLLPPLALAAYASIFVYRRTARRRALQAILTALFTMVLAFGLLAILLPLVPTK